MPHPQSTVADEHFESSGTKVLVTGPMCGEGFKKREIQGSLNTIFRCFFAPINCFVFGGSTSLLPWQGWYTGSTCEPKANFRQLRSYQCEF